MTRWLALAAALSASSCIDWEGAGGEARARRCLEVPSDPGCLAVVPDAGPSDAGMLDGGAGDAGVVDAGLHLAWVSNAPNEARFLVGDETGGTFVAFDGGLVLTAVTALGVASSSYVDAAASRPTAAFERAGLLAIAFESRAVVTRFRQDYAATLTTQTPDFVTTAMDLYPRAGNQGVAVYGPSDGGMGVSSFVATTGAAADGTAFVACTGPIVPMRILPAPDAGFGVVVGTVNGQCGAPFEFTATGGFVGRFGPQGTGGFSFPASLAGPLTLGLIGDELRVASPDASSSRVSTAAVPSTGNSLGPSSIAVEGPLRPVELVDLPGAEHLLVGWASGSVSAPSGVAVSTSGEDIVIVRIDDATGATRSVNVLVEPGDQRVVGAFFSGATLVIGGSCTGGRLCSGGASAFVAGLNP